MYHFGSLYLTCPIFILAPEQVDNLNSLHKQELKPFEDKDDEYQNKAREMYKAVSSRGERWGTRMENAGEAVKNSARGLVIEAKAAIKAGYGMVKRGSAIIIVNTYPKFMTPEFAEESANQTKEGMKAILKEPWLITEGMAQGASDTIGEEGIAYMVGGAIPDAAVAWFTKGGSVGLKSAKTAEDVLDAGGTGAKNQLPHIKNATIDSKKVTEYALNPDHPVGGNKAKVFESALGYNKSNADDLIKQINEKLPESEAVLGKADQYGQRYTVDIPMTGPNGKTATVRTGWILESGSTTPRMTTVYVK